MDIGYNFKFKILRLNNIRPNVRYGSIPSIYYSLWIFWTKITIFFLFLPCTNIGGGNKTESSKPYVLAENSHLIYSTQLISSFQCEFDVIVMVFDVIGLFGVSLMNLYAN